ncbi:hypothetical protein ES708_27357 [subsurface metagenome]
MAVFCCLVSMPGQCNRSFGLLQYSLRKSNSWTESETSPLSVVIPLVEDLCVLGYTADEYKGKYRGLPCTEG